MPRAASVSLWPPWSERSGSPSRLLRMKRLWFMLSRRPAAAEASIAGSVRPWTTSRALTSCLSLAPMPGSPSRKEPASPKNKPKRPSKANASALSPSERWNSPPPPPLGSSRAALDERTTQSRPVRPCRKSRASTPPSSTTSAWFSLWRRRNHLWMLSMPPLRHTTEQPRESPATTPCSSKQASRNR